MDPRIKIALKVMGQTTPGQLTLSGVAQTVGLSPSRFEHILKETTGKSFRQHIQRSRIVEAKRLLGNWQLSLKEIAYLTGYSSPASFSRAFRSTVRKSPSQYRLSSRFAQRKSDEAGLASGSGK
jgi:transcriptional regulator GlxA family with amidase domain